MKVSPKTNSIWADHNFLFYHCPFSDKLKYVLENQGLYTVAQSWTHLHILCIFQLHELLAQVILSKEFKIPFVLDIYGKTPLHYLIAPDKMNENSINMVLNSILDYLEDKARDYFEKEAILKSLSPLFLFITSKANPKARDRYLKNCFMTSYSSEELPMFGEPQLQSNPCLAKMPIIYPEIKSQIWKDGHNQVVFKSNVLSLDYSSTSDDMIGYVLILSQITDEDIFKNPFISNLIEYIWTKNEKDLKIVAALFSILMILFSIYIGFGDRNLGLEIAILCFTVFFLIGELLQMQVLKQRYFQGIWDCLDSSFLLLTIAFIIFKFTDPDEDSLASEWMSTVIILIGYLRWVSYLRIFEPTSKTIP